MDARVFGEGENRYERNRKKTNNLYPVAGVLPAFCGM